MSSYILIHVEYIHLHLGHLGTIVIVSGLCIDTTALLDLRQYIGSMRLRTNFMPGVLSRVSLAKKESCPCGYIYIYITLVVLLTTAM